MRWYVLMPALAVLLTACTGSSEEPARALLTAGVNNPISNTYQIRFFQSSTLQPGSIDPPRRVGSWDLDEPIVALLYRRSLGVGNDQLWVLTQSRLRRYTTNSLTIDDVGTPQLDGFDQALGTDCSQGYLRQGQGAVLLVCPPPPANPPRPLEEYQAWIIPFTANTLPTPIDFRDPNLNLIRLTPPARLALGPGDQLLYLTPAQVGLYDFVNPSVERPLSLGTSRPTDLIFVGGQALGLFDDNDPTTTDTTLVSWNLGATSEVGLVRDSNIAARAFARGAPPVSVLGTGLARFEGSFQLPRETETGLLRTRRYSTAAVGIDQFLYIADLDFPTLLVIDLTVNWASALTSAGVRSSSLGVFQDRIASLVFIPVE